jgi:hypothetical protein
LRPPRTDAPPAPAAEAAAVEAAPPPASDEAPSPPASIRAPAAAAPSSPPPASRPQAAPAEDGDVALPSRYRPGEATPTGGDGMARSRLLLLVVAGFVVATAILAALGLGR